MYFIEWGCFCYLNYFSGLILFDSFFTFEQTNDWGTFFHLQTRYWYFIHITLLMIANIVKFFKISFFVLICVRESYLPEISLYKMPACFHCLLHINSIFISLNRHAKMQLIVLFLQFHYNRDSRKNKCVYSQLIQLKFTYWLYFFEIMM